MKHLIVQNACSDLERKYPKIFTNIELLRISMKMNWSELIYLPIEHQIALLTHTYKLTQFDAAKNVSHVAALAAWRMAGKNVCVIHEDIFEELMEHADEIKKLKIPVDVLTKLPFNCVAVPLIVDSGCELLIHYDYENPSTIELRFTLVDNDGDSLPLFFPLRSGSTIEQTVNDAYDKGWFANYGVDVNDILNVLVQYLNIALYLCAENTEYEPLDPNTPPRPTQTSFNAKRIFAPNQNTIWQVGYRVGAAIGAGKRVIKSLQNKHTGKTVRTHWRSSHWHTFRVGFMRKEIIVRWLHPILVNAPSDLSDDEIAEIMPVVEH